MLLFSVAGFIKIDNQKIDNRKTSKNSEKKLENHLLTLTKYSHKKKVELGTLELETFNPT